jgi:carboxyl-terminal processing protease
MPKSLSAGVALVRTGLMLLALGLAACVEREPMPVDPVGRLYARGLDEIADLYIAPVSSRKLALAAAARVSALDPKLAVTETPGPERGTQIVLAYAGREAATYPNPRGDDPHSWGGWLGRMVLDAKAASPVLQALPEERIDKALFDGITGALDRFSRYASPETARDHRAARDGFGGIGVTLDSGKDDFLITAVAPGGPAESAGIRPQDRIVAVDGVPTAGRSQTEVIRQLRGPILSSVSVAIERAGGQRREIRLQRALIVIPTVTMSREDGVVILKVSGFNQNTTQQIVDDLNAAQRAAGKGVRGIVLDLRGNPGGLLDQAVSLSDVFIAKGAIVATIGRHPASRQYFEASGDSVAPRLPLVVLINGASASSSEIVAAALQDIGRAVVVGSASYGKGTVQTVLRLPNDGELTLTWAQLVMPSGYRLNEHGVIPTLCTSDLGDDEGSLQRALQRIGGPASRPRASLDENGWTQLRHACPARQDRRAIDLAVAKRLLGDPTLYSEAVHMLTESPNLAAKPAAATPTAPALTGAGAALSSSPR